MKKLLVVLRNMRARRQQVKAHSENIARWFIKAKSTADAMDILKRRGHIDRDLDVLPDQNDIQSHSSTAERLIINFLIFRKEQLARTLLASHPAFALFMEGTELESMRAGMWGEHIERTNIVCVSKSTPNLLNTLTHEQIHYLASLLRSTRPISPGYYGCVGMPSERVFIPWFDEGMTEFLTEAILKHNKLPTQRDSYLRELAALDHLVNLVGSDLFIEAYLSSDVTELVARLTRTLGPGTTVKLFGDPSDRNHTRFPTTAQVSGALGLELS